MCPEPEPSGAEDPVADRELSDGGADVVDLSCKFGAEDSVPRPAEAGDQSAHEGDGQPAPAVGFTSSGVEPIHRRGVDPDEDLVLRGDGPLDLFESQNLWRPVPVVDHR